MKNFTIWLFKRWYKGLTSIPRKHYGFIKHSMRYDVMPLIISTIGLFIFGSLGIIGALLLHNSLTSAGKYDTHYEIILIAYNSYLVLSLLVGYIGVQYDYYKEELERTMRVLKTGVDEPYPYYSSEEDPASIHARLLAAQQAHQAQQLQAAKQSMNTVHAGGYGGPSLHNRGRTTVV